jgi:hypothetical protein
LLERAGGLVALRTDVDAIKSIGVTLIEGRSRLVFTDGAAAAGLPAVIRVRHRGAALLRTRPANIAASAAAAV